MLKLIGLDLLAFRVIAVISSGNKENIEKIEEELNKSNLVTYLNEKYKDIFMVNFEQTYNIDELNNYFTNFAGYVQGNEGRKYGVINNDDGLLLTLALIIDGLELPKETLK